MSLTQKRNAMKIHLRAQMDDILMRLKELDEQSAEAANCSWNSIYQKIETDNKNLTALIICNKITEHLKFVKKYNEISEIVLIDSNPLEIGDLHKLKYWLRVHFFLPNEFFFLAASD